MIKTRPAAERGHANLGWLDTSYSFSFADHVFASVLDAGAAVSHSIEAGRHAWIQVVQGELRVLDTVLTDGDGAAISDEGEIEIRAEKESEFLLLDLP